MHGGTNSVLSNLARSGNDDYVVRRQYLRVTAADQRRIIGELRQAEEDLAATRSRLATEQKAADAAAADAARPSAPPPPRKRPSGPSWAG